VSVPRTDLLCIGNAIVDVFTRSDSAFFERFEIFEPVQHIERDKADAMLKALGIDPEAEAFDAAQPLAAFSSGGGGAPLSSGKAIFCSGGGAANVAKIAAMVGMNASFAGCVGEDALAAVFRRQLAEAGVAALLRGGKEKTGICLILGDRKTGTRIAASPAAALEFTGNDLNEEMISAAEIVVLDGYCLNRRPLVRRILQLADRRGIPAALDVASVFQVREKAEELLHYSRNYPLFVFMNADEALAFYHTINKTQTESTGLGEREKESMILRDVCPMLKIITDGELYPIIAIKLGGRGAVVVAGGAIYREETFAIVKPRDVVGAGDAFCAAFLSAWIRGKSLSECAALGNKVAREILEVPGTRIKAEKLKSFAKLLRP
jgi:sugar/nucleoside kinase (ribokinase family)